MTADAHTDRMPSRRTALLAAALVPMGVWAFPAPRVQVWKDPSCGCCGDWITHLQHNGFEVVVAGANVTAMKERLRVPPDMRSCHTAVVGRYFLEGHVPAREIHRLLREQPRALGLAVPGMPIGSPGMDGPQYGPRQDRYRVWLVREVAPPAVFQTYPL